MDNSIDKITFDEKGECNYCKNYDEKKRLYGYKGPESDQQFTELIGAIKKVGKGKEYDCIVGISGGVDSAYLTYLAKKEGLRILAVHVDAGWNSEIAVTNIQKLCNKLEIDLHTVVVDWPAMKELQRAYMFSGIPNLDTPQDHVFAAAVYEYAQKYHIYYVLNGSNIATEGILTEGIEYDTVDFQNIKDIYKKNGRGKKIFEKIPHFNVWKYIYMQSKVKQIKLLNYVPYSKTEAIQLLTDQFGWEYYGGKHYESRFTKFYQGYYLPLKFNWDKRRDHYSCLILNEELTRSEAIEKLKRDDDINEKIEDRDYVLKKLDITPEEWKKILEASVKTEDDYKNSKRIIETFVTLKHLIAG